MMDKDRFRLDRWLWCGVVAVALLWMATPASAMPNFARQYEVTCNYCHTIIPRLNKTGYEFRRAGFRLPGEIGEIRPWEKDREGSTFADANYYSFRLQGNISTLRRNHATATGGYDPASDDTFTRTQLEFKEFTLYPITGGFLGHWAAEGEISGGTDEIEVENAYIRYTAGDEEKFWETRFGIFHPFEGYGASDRPLGLSRPLIQSHSTTNALGDTNGWHPWGFDQTGLEGGLHVKNTSISLAVFNGLIENADDPAQGGGLKKAAGSPTENDKDFQLFFNQFFGGSDAALSLYYYNGRLSLGEEALYENKFERYALYFTYPTEKLQLLAGYSAGSDEDSITNRSVDNSGWYVEVDGYLSERLGIGARYDQFDPTDLIPDSDVRAFSVYVNQPFNNGLQWIAEVRSVQTEKGPGLPDRTDNSINVRLIYIF